MVSLVHERDGHRPKPSVTCDLMRAAVRLLEQNLNLPAGYYVKLDERTDNIIVANDKLGFCVTSIYVRDHADSYVTAAQAYLQQLIDINEHPERWSEGVFYTPAQMEQQASATGVD